MRHKIKYSAEYGPNEDDERIIIFRKRHVLGNIETTLSDVEIAHWNINSNSYCLSTSDPDFWSAGFSLSGYNSGEKIISELKDHFEITCYNRMDDDESEPAGIWRIELLDPVTNFVQEYRMFTSIPEASNFLAKQKERVPPDDINVTAPPGAGDAAVEQLTMLAAQRSFL